MGLQSFPDIHCSDSRIFASGVYRVHAAEWLFPQEKAVARNKIAICLQIKKMRALCTPEGRFG